jgi:hypothetical protein
MRKVLILIAFLLFSLIFSGLVGAPEGKIKEELLQYLETVSLIAFVLRGPARHVEPSGTIAMAMV